MVLGILYLKYSSRHCYPVDLAVYNAVKAFFFEEKKRCCGQYLCAWTWKIEYRDTFPIWKAKSNVSSVGSKMHSK